MNYVLIEGPIVKSLILKRGEKLEYMKISLSVPVSDDKRNTITFIAKGTIAQRVIENHTVGDILKVKGHIISNPVVKDGVYFKYDILADQLC